MSEVLFDEVVHTDYGQFDILYDDDGGFDGDADRFFAGQLNGLVGAADPHGIYLVLGRRSGGSAVRIVRLEATPADDPSWEDVVEVSTTVPPGTRVGTRTWDGDHKELVGGLEPGDYRVRVSARGRDEGHADEGVGRVVDHYLVELWPAPLRADTILRTTSADAAYWHREWGSRR